MTSTDISTPWPDVPKTPTMLELEQRRGGIDIRDIMLEAIKLSGHDYEAATSMQIGSDSFSRWLRVLNIYNQAREIRQSQRR